MARQAIRKIERNRIHSIPPAVHGWRICETREQRIQKEVELAKAKKVSKKQVKPSKVGIVMGSDSDLAVMQEAANILTKFQIPYEMTVASAHRSPQREVYWRPTHGCRLLGCPLILPASRVWMHCLPPSRCRPEFQLPPWPSANPALAMPAFWPLKSSQRLILIWGKNSPDSSKTWPGRLIKRHRGWRRFKAWTRLLVGKCDWRFEVGGLNILPFSLKPLASGLKPCRRLHLSRVGHRADQPQATGSQQPVARARKQQPVTIDQPPVTRNQNPEECHHPNYIK